MLPRTASDIRFESMGTPRRVWAVSSLHGEAKRLERLHRVLFRAFKPGDRLVYLGGYTGYGIESANTIDELLLFRRSLLARDGMRAADIIYLRGQQEEIWQKLLELPFAPNPVDVLLWMLGNGLSATLQSYGMSAHDGVIAAQEGTMSLIKWTGAVRDEVRRRPGHEAFSMNLRRAAYTPPPSDCPLLFVHAGLDPSRPLVDQGDSLWWAGESFGAMAEPYAPFQRVIRGFDPSHKGMYINGVTATVDGGSGFGGAPLCAGFDASGNVFEVLES